MLFSNQRTQTSDPLNLNSESLLPTEFFKNLKKPEAFLQQHDQKNTSHRWSRAADKEISLRDVKKSFNYLRKGGRTEEEEAMPK